MSKVFLIASSLAFLMPALSAHAQGVPDFLLQESYKKCLGGEDPAADPERAAYCDCVAQDMRNWDADAFISAIGENPQDPSSKLNKTAHACMAKVMRQ